MNALALAGCGGSDDVPRLSPATAGTLANCTSLASGFSFANPTITSATVIAAGTLSNAGQPVGEHCRITGRMNPRTSAVDGQAFAIGFEMRLPKEWSGCFLYQGNGGIDGVAPTADGGLSIGSGGLLKNGLQLGFAIISADAGHRATRSTAWLTAWCRTPKAAAPPSTSTATCPPAPVRATAAA